MACVYPELLLSSVQEQLQPLVGYLQGLGCSAAQAARLLQVRAGHGCGHECSQSLGPSAGLCRLPQLLCPPLCLKQAC